VTTVSTPEWISLAKHLKATGAQMYGAFWCSHCFEQKVLFGAEAVREGFGYVECFPDGYKYVCIGNIQSTLGNVQST
jgi:hypothetical protein